MISLSLFILSSLSRLSFEIGCKITLFLSDKQIFKLFYNEMKVRAVLFV